MIERQADQIIDSQRPLLDELDSLAAFKQWRDMLVGLQRQRHCEGGCPLGSLSGELAETKETARTALAAGFDRWEAPIRDGLRRMRDRGELQDDTNVDRLALGTLAALQGGLLLTQAKRDVGALAAALDLAIGQIDATSAEVRSPRLPPNSRAPPTPRPEPPARAGNAAPLIPQPAQAPPGHSARAKPRPADFRCARAMRTKGLGGSLPSAIGGQMPSSSARRPPAPTQPSASNWAQDRAAGEGRVR